MFDANGASLIEGLATWELEAVAEINQLEVAADESEADASAVRWEQAERVAKALDAGMTQRKLADYWKRPDGTSYTHVHVGFTAKTWRTFGNLSYQERPRYNEAYNSDDVRGKLPTAHVSQNTGETEWFTPPEYIRAALSVMGSIDLDPASTPAANKVVGAEKFFTKEDDGLAQPWHGRVWMNPPYAQPLIDRFSEKLVTEYRADRVEAACVLVNNATDTTWFQRMGLVANALCFPNGRIRFWHPDKPSASPLQGQALLYFGDDPERFVKHFKPFGLAFRL